MHLNNCAVLNGNNSNSNFLQIENPFSSFWMAGYECTDKLNAFGNRVDFLKLTGHLHLLEEDYKLLGDFNIQTVREGIRWSQVETSPYNYNWNAVEQMIRKGQQMKIQQVWDLCHFGYPDDITPLHPLFARRFSAMCRSFVNFYRSIVPEGKLIVTPINEVSFISWLGGDARGTSPYCINNGWEVKYRLMAAYIEAIHAMREIDKNLLVLTTEPLISQVPSFDAGVIEIAESFKQHDLQYQATDILYGTICPELGGSPACIDMVGVNYYYTNQWITGTGEFLPWANENNDPRWRHLSSLFKEVHQRYNKPIVLSETSHPGIDRPSWIHFIAEECAATIQQNIPLWGICLYPIIDRPDWDHLDPWHNSGLWDVDITDGKLSRQLYLPYAQALLQAQKKIEEAINSNTMALNVA